MVVCHHQYDRQLRARMEASDFLSFLHRVQLQHHYVALPNENENNTTQEQYFHIFLLFVVYQSHWLGIW